MAMPEGSEAQCGVHPDHDAVAREVRSWYTSSFAEIGLTCDVHWFGFLTATEADRARAILTIDSAEEVAAALAAARKACAVPNLTVLVDEHARAARLDAALRRHGCSAGEATAYLALTGQLSSGAGPVGLEIASVGEPDLGTWARVRVRSFADSEEPPAESEVAAEVARRRAELPLAEYQLGSLDGEAVSVLAHYPGTDQLVFILGTRVPYRHRGIAQGMLRRWADAGTAAGCRSLIINAHDGGQPAALYRRIGFTDEVYWYQRYELTAG